MVTESPIRNTMLEVVTSTSSGLIAIELAGRIIAADAAFSLEVARAHGPDGYSTADRLFERTRSYEQLVENARGAWLDFKAAVARNGVVAVEPHEALERALRDIQRALEDLTAHK